MARTKLSPEERAHEAAVYADGVYHYPVHSWILIATVIGIATVLNVGSIFWAWKQRHKLRRGTRTLSKPFVSEKDRKASMKRFPAATATAMRILSYRIRIPFVSMTVMELFLTIGYMVALFIWDFVNTFHLGLNWWQARAADLGTAQLPLLVALALKNNVLEFLIGISHEKMNMMHRTTSRVVLISIWLHSGGIYYQYYPLRVRPYIWERMWIVMGTVATIAQTLLTILGTKWFRQRYYEFFWITHVILVFVFLVTTYLHCDGLSKGSPFRYYVWPCFLIWGLDRAARYARYIILGNFLAPNKSPATIEIISPDAYRITVRRRFPKFFPGSGWRAGQHMFVAFPTIGPIESHPFTIASIAEPIPEDQVKDGEKADERELMWIVRTRDGLTRRLRDKAQDKNGVLKVPIFMDGPYGAPPDITGFTTCVFIAGGSGIAYTMPRMRELFNQVNEGIACARRVAFIWAIRHPSHIEWMAAEFLKALASKPKDVEASFLVYITATPAVDHSHPHSPTTTVKESHRSDSPISPTSSTPPTTVCGDSDPEKMISVVPTLEKSAPAHGRLPSTYSTGDPESCSDEKSLVAHSNVDWEAMGVEIHFGRPDVYTLLEKAVTTSEGAVSVDVSGPESLVATIRKTLSSPFVGPMNVLRGCPSVQLNVEDFSM